VKWIARSFDSILEEIGQNGAETMVSGVIFLCGYFGEGAVGMGGWRGLGDFRWHNHQISAGEN
jgi:hypothetical protein